MNQLEFNKKPDVSISDKKNIKSHRRLSRHFYGFTQQHKKSVKKKLNHNSQKPTHRARKLTK